MSGPMHLWRLVPVPFYSRRGAAHDVFMRQCPHGRLHFDPAHDTDCWMIGPESCDRDECRKAVRVAHAEFREHRKQVAS